MKSAFIYSDKFADFSYGGGHPMRPMRLKLTYDLITERSLLTGPDIEVVEARMATDPEILLFHRPEYLETLKAADSGEVPINGPEHGLGFGDNPVFPGVFEWSAYSAGASIQAAELVNSRRADLAFNICGGLHHAMADRAAGFCYLNDPVLAIKYLIGQGKRVAYVDIDAHHGDGVELAFYDSNKVLTISIHESGKYLFPGTGFTEDRGTGEGVGYAINIPLAPETGDEEFVNVFKEIVPSAIDTFAPDILVTQLGVDTFATDPITHLNLTIEGFKEMIARFKGFNLPWVALGGGGYNMDNVKQAWTGAWEIMIDRKQ